MLELMVVLFIIGIITSFVILSINNQKDTKCCDEVKRLVAIMKLLNEESILTNKTLAISIHHSGYAFLLHDGKTWNELKNDEILHKHSFFSKPEIDLFLDGKPVIFNTDPDFSVPYIVFISSGEITPFEFTFSCPDKDEVYTIVGSLSGEIQLKPL